MRSSETSRQSAAVSHGSTAGRDARRQAKRRQAVALGAAVAGVGLLAPSARHGGEAQAADIRWNGTTADYTTAANWSSGTIPGGGDNAIVDNGGNVLIQPGDPAWTVNDLRAGDGANTTGVYTQTGSTVTLNSWFRLGDSDGASGYYNESGTGTAVKVGGIADIGEQNAGYLNISSGALFQTTGGGEFDIAGRNASGHARGVVNVDGAGTTLQTLGGELWVGNSGAGNMGYLNVTNGATLSVNNWISTGRGGSGGLMNVSGGSVVRKTGGGNTIAGDGGTATINLTDSTMTLSTGELWMGQSGGSNGTINVNGTSSISVSSWIAIGRGGNGFLNLNSGTITKVPGTGGRTVIASGGSGSNGTFTQTGGTFNSVGVPVSGGGSTFGVDVEIGEVGTGFYNMSGGTANLNNLSAGESGVAGTLNLSGTATLNAATLYVGRAGSVNGTVNMTGGTANISQLVRGSTRGTVSATLSGGTINNNTGQDNANFITGFKPGELNLNGTTINTGTNNLGVSGALSGSGNIIKTGTGTLTINASDTNTASTHSGQMVISQGTVRLAAPTAVIPAASVAAFYPLNTIQKDPLGEYPQYFQNTTKPYASGEGLGTGDTGGTLTASTNAPPGAGHSGSTVFAGGATLVNANGGVPAGTPLGNAAYTFGAWINLSTAANNGSNGATGNSGTDGIIGYGNYGTGDQVNAFRTANGGATAVNNYWWDHDIQSNTTGSTSLVGNWHYVATTYDPSAGNTTGGYGLRTLYMDGAVIGSDDPGIQHNAQASGFLVGATNILANPAEFFSGNMADLIIGTTAFTPAQLAAAAASDNPLAANTSGGFASAASTFNIASGSTFDLNGQNQTLAGLLGSGSVTLGAGTLTVSNTAASRFDGTVSGTGGLTKSGTGTFTIGGAAGSLTYTGVTTVNAGTLAFATPTGASGITARNLSGGVVVNGGTLALPVASTSATRTLLITPSLSFASNGSSGALLGKVDVGNGDLLVRAATPAAAAASLATLSSAAASGFAGGLWNGNGLASSAAAADTRHLTGVGVIQNATVIGGSTAVYTSFDGRTVTSSDVLVRDTYYGDTDLSGTVNAADYSRIDAGFLMNLTGWQNGDFNYDGVVDGSDYTLADNSFNQQSNQVGAPAALVAASRLFASPAALVAGGSAVPEPATLGVLAVGVIGTLGRRRGRSSVKRTH